MLTAHHCPLGDAVRRPNGSRVDILTTVLSGGDWRRRASTSVGAPAARTQKPGGGPQR